MPAVDVVVESPVSDSIRVRQVSSMFDCPLAERSRIEWKGELPIEADPWNVGLIVGPSGSGKSTIARTVFGGHVELTWAGRSVIDDFDSTHSVEAIAGICQAVGFNTIPAWMRPYAVLSTGEKFRVDLARRLLELPDPVVCDEFTSVVDRQVAQIGAHAVQKYVRKFVAVGCHYDVIDWLQPDWIFEPATMAFTRRSLQPRPELDCVVSRVPYGAWHLFAPFHYLTADLHRSARCFCLFVKDRPAAFAGMLHRPHPKVRDITGCSRLVTLPDWQGLGLAMALIDTLGSAFKAVGKRLHTYPAHPALIRSFDRSKCWKLERKPGSVSPPSGNRRRLLQGEDVSSAATLGGRPCAVFEYAGSAMERGAATRLLG
jgi:energy-coupling factor transporter ATP-binding protein EcfA2/GNAT superfamily N-acetyltransferase